MIKSNSIKWLNYSFIALLVSFAALQYNDPDSGLWITFYALGAYICFSNLFSVTKIRLVVITLFSAVLLFFLISNWPESFSGFEQSAESPDVNVEKARESGGLIIILNFIWLSTWMSLKKSA